MSLKLRLLLAIIPLILVSILMMGGMSLSVAIKDTEKALTLTSKQKLTSQNSQTKALIESYFSTVESQLRSKSNTAAVQQAAQDFAAAFANYQSQRPPLSGAQTDTLNQYYNHDFTTRYNERNPSALTNSSRLIASLDDNAQALQYDFIAGSSLPIGNKDGLYSLNNSTDYANVHERYHADFRQFLQEFGFYDIFIIEPDNGQVVYSVFKELDFATSIASGPYAATGIGQAYQQALKATDKNQVFFSDLQAYLPSYNALAGFLSSPIMVNGQTVGVLIFQLPLDRLNQLVTHQQRWNDVGFGLSGETYLVNPDSTLLTESRFFIEDQPGYLAVLKQTIPTVAEQIAMSNTSVGIQPVDSTSAQQALAGNAGFNVIEDYRGVEVFSVYSPVTIGNNTYGLIAEIDTAEALQALQAVQSDLINTTIIEFIVILSVAIVVAVLLANRLVKPLNDVGDRCAQLAQGEGDLTIRLQPSGIPEIDRIVIPFNQFISQIRDIVKNVKQDAESLASASEELSAITEQSESTTVQQRDMTHQVATALEELSVSISEIAKSTQETQTYSSGAHGCLRENMERADMATDNIKLLVQLIQDSSQIIMSLQGEVNQITSVLNVITSIADQTNLLALNAAIEAARAGDAGRGFSVVADEVRALANRSQENTVEISKIVEKMNVSSDKSVKAMEQAAAAADGGIHLVDLVTAAMNELSQTLDSVSSMTTTVAAATEQQDLTSSSVSGNVGQINEMAHDVEVGAKQTSEAASELARIANRSSELVSRFTV